MGKYINALNNMSIENFEFNTTFGNDTFTPAIEGANDFTNGWLGIGVLTPIWFSLYQHLSNRENQFELTKLQTLVSVNTLVFTLAIVLVFIELLVVPQHFVFIMVLLFISAVVGVLRTA